MTLEDLYTSYITGLSEQERASAKLMFRYAVRHTLRRKKAIPLSPQPHFNQCGPMTERYVVMTGYVRPLFDRFSVEELKAWIETHIESAGVNK